MGSLSSVEQRKLAYFHALGKVMTENTQNVYESLYKSSHNVKLNEVWTDDITFASTYVDAVAESVSNSAVTLVEEVVLDEILGSNGQSYSYVSGTTFIRPWISPVDVPDSITNAPSNGYIVRLFRGDDATIGIPGSEIYQGEGAWTVDYYAGIIHFAEGNTPNDLGWGSIKTTFFYYTGDFGAGTDPSAFNDVVFYSGSTELIFNEGTVYEQSVNLSYLDNVDAFVTADFIDANSTIVFNSGLTSETLVDLSSIKNVTGVTSLISVENSNMIVEDTNSGSTLACNIAIQAGNITNSKTMVFVNGVQVNVGNLVTDDCYFSNNGGVTKKISGQESAGDYLYWNYIGGNPVAGYELDSTKDTISFIYLTL